jgi:ribosomal protein L11 methyltransferase
MQYIEIHIKEIDIEKRELMFASLPSFGFSQFEELDAAIKAYASSADADMEGLKEWMKSHVLHFDVAILEETNWNASWEANFQPVEIPGKILVRADFHPSNENVIYDIVITPKMSFGTGHHATTRMMMEAMFEIDFTGKRVLDFGTGTGILAILAEKMGASDVLAIDNDQWSYENALENIQKNHATKVTVQLKDDLLDLDSFDIILANINKNVLTEHVLDLRQLLVSNGCLIISGLLSTDYEDIRLKYDSLFGFNIKHFSESGWIALTFKL